MFMATGHLNNVEGFIKAITSYGGEDYPQFEEWYTPQNAIRFQAWLKDQPKVSGRTLYRGYTFDKRYFQDANFFVGGFVGVDALTQESMPSFTPSILRAARYVNEYGEVGLDDVVRVVFIIRTNGKAFVDIASFSHYPEEEEHKCTDDVLLKVKRIAWPVGVTQIELEEV